MILGQEGDFLQYHQRELFARFSDLIKKHCALLLRQHHLLNTHLIIDLQVVEVNTGSQVGGV